MRDHDDEAADEVQDPMDKVGHLLIRATNGDGLDPFFVHGHPNWPTREDQIVRACFYYAIIMTPKVTLLFDNDGRGGMCELVPDEISGAWRTPDLLAVLGVGFDELKNGTAIVDAVSLPPPLCRPGMEAMPDEEPTAAPAPSAA